MTREVYQDPEATLLRRLNRLVDKAINEGLDSSAVDRIAAYIAQRFGTPASDE